MAWAIDDRFTKGMIAGTVAGLVLAAENLSSYYLFHFTKRRALDFASILIYGHTPHGLWESLFAELAVFVFTAVLGIIFAFLVPGITSKNYLLKGWMFSVFLWFSIYVIGTLYKTPIISKIDLPTAASNFISTSIFGVVLAYVLRLLDKRTERRPAR
ncbi:MAG: DUF6789 family protein [Bacteroidota bacterium]